MTHTPQDHGGGLDAALEIYGGTRADWLDLSTGINPVPYCATLPDGDHWTALPDAHARNALINAARVFWDVPPQAAILAAPGASVLIAQIPGLMPSGRVEIPQPTYNEHAASFQAHGWHIAQTNATAQVVVNPNNPDGRLWQAEQLSAPFRIIDESFCDIAPQHSLIALAAQKNTIVLKSFGKFWGLAGLRLGFAIGDPDHIAQLAQRIGPWAVSGPALHIGAQALNDHDWAAQTRQRLHQDAARLDGLMSGAGAQIIGGTPLFRLFQVPDAQDWHDRLARHEILSRIFPYNPRWLRLGLPAQNRWSQLEKTLI